MSLKLYRDYPGETKHHECKCGDDPHAHPPGLYLQLDSGAGAGLVTDGKSEPEKVSQRPGTSNHGQPRPASLAESHGFIQHLISAAQNSAPGFYPEYSLNGKLSQRDSYKTYTHFVDL